MPAIAQEMEVAAARSATQSMLVDRSRAMSNRNGARVVPLEAAANMASAPAASNAQGMGWQTGYHGRRLRARRTAAATLTVVERSAASPPPGADLLQRGVDVHDHGPVVG